MCMSVFSSDYDLLIQLILLRQLDDFSTDWIVFFSFFLKIFPFLSFQLGNIRRIRKISFFHHAGGGRVHNGELCNKWCDYYSS